MARSLVRKLVNSAFFSRMFLPQHWRIFLVLWFTTLCVLLFLLSNSRVETEKQLLYLGEIFSLSGSARIKRQGNISWTKSIVGDRVLEGDYLATDQDSELEVKFSDETTITIGPLSILKLVRPSLFRPDIELALIEGVMSSPATSQINEKHSKLQREGPTKDNGNTEKKSTESGLNFVLKTEEGMYRLLDWKHLEIRRDIVQGSGTTRFVKLEPEIPAEKRQSNESIKTKLTENQDAESKSFRDLPSVQPAGGRFVLFSSAPLDQIEFPFSLVGQHANKTQGWIPLIRVFGPKQSWTMDDSAKKNGVHWNLEFSKFASKISNDGEYIDVALQTGAMLHVESSSRFDTRFSQDLSFFKFMVISDSDQLLLNLTDLKYMHSVDTGSWLKVIAPEKISYRLSLLLKADRQHLAGFVRGALNRVTFEKWTSFPNEAYFLVRGGQIIGFLESAELTRSDIQLLVSKLNLDVIFFGSPQLFLGKFRQLDLEGLRKNKKPIFLLNRGSLVKLSQDLLFSDLSAKSLLDQSDDYAFSGTVNVEYAADK